MPVWTMERALVMLRSLQVQIIPTGYHLALGGGVLNKGCSDKDLDVYFLPRLGETNDTKWLLRILHRNWGSSEKIGTSGGNHDGIYRDKLKFSPKMGRIDAFVVEV